MTARASAGRAGEDYAAKKLEELGYAIVARNYHSRYGEIDLVARQGGVLCFVEVKTRRNLSVALPREAVTGKKQEKLRAAAALYLEERKLDCPARFDVAEVYLKAGRRARIDYIKNAF